MKKNDMRMLRWMCKVTKKDKIRTQYTRSEERDTSIQEDHREKSEMERACDEDGREANCEKSKCTELQGEGDQSQD